MDKKLKRRLIQAGLFLLTLITTTLSGAEWMHGWLFFYVPEPLGWQQFMDGFQYSIPFLLILTVHEFGHYLTARYHKVKVSLPYYIPVWFGFLGTVSLGTMGAFIRIRQRITSISQTFDIGVAGPLAGFVVAIGVLFYGFTHLPPKEHIFEIHPEYQLFGDDYKDIVYSKDTFYLRTDLEKIAPLHAARMGRDTIFMNQEGELGFKIGSSILFDYMKNNWVSEEDLDKLPNDHELMHYPLLLAGFLALMFTALNLLPIGQLDGGHIIFGMFGAQMHSYISKSFYVLAIFYAGLGVGFLGFINPFIINKPISDLLIDLLLYIGLIYYLLQRVFDKKQTQLMVALFIYVGQMGVVFLWPTATGYSGWFLFILIVGRYIRVQHPTTEINEQLSPLQNVLGWAAIIIFIISFSLKPLVLG